MFLLWKIIFCAGFLQRAVLCDQAVYMGGDSTQQIISSFQSPTVNISIEAPNDIVLSSQVDLVNSGDRESNLGNFLTDVMVNTFKNMTNMAILQSKLLNFCKISKGEITVKSLENFSGIMFSLVNIRGTQLRSIFEKSVASYDEDGLGDSQDSLKVSGVRLEFDLTKEVVRD